MRRKPTPLRPDPRPQWQIEQGKRCACNGQDDMCPCQNENPWPRPVIDWETRAREAEAKVQALTEGLERAQNIIDEIRDRLHASRIADWYPEGAHNAASHMSEEMRLIGNWLADQDVRALLHPTPSEQGGEHS